MVKMHPATPAPQSCTNHATPTGHTLVEMLVVVVTISVLLGAVIKAPRLLATNARVTALQQVAAVLDEARSQALRGKGAAYVAFSVPGSTPPLQACRHYAIFLEDDDTQQIRQISEWRSLPAGLIFNPNTVAPAGVAWTNTFSADAQSRKNFPVTGAANASLPSIGFGPLGEIVHPAQGVSGPFALVLSEGVVKDAQVIVPSPASNLSLEVRRSSGKAIMHP